jgi:anti-anti-sigma factor
MYDRSPETMATAAYAVPSESAPVHPYAQEPDVTTIAMYQTGPETTAARFSGSQVSGHVVFRPSGALTYETRAELSECILASAERQPRVILDFRDTTLMDSEMLELLLDVSEVLEQRGGMLKLVNLSPICRDIIDATRLAGRFALFENLGSAVRGS